MAGFRRALLLALSLWLHPGGHLHAQEVPGDRDDVMAVVGRLFDGMRARDGAMVASVFHPEARLISTGVDPQGSPRTQVTAIDGFVTAVGQPGEPWDEPLFDPEVRVDGHLAHVWVFYHFYLGDTFSHCGFDSIQLVRMPDGWRIISLADTRRTEGCDR